MNLFLSIYISMVISITFIEIAIYWLMVKLGYDNFKKVLTVEYLGESFIETLILPPYTLIKIWKSIKFWVRYHIKNWYTDAYCFIMKYTKQPIELYLWRKKTKNWTNEQIDEELCKQADELLERMKKSNEKERFNHAEEIMKDTKDGWR
jgi:hypothetical protein